jgi:hypothetical protein
MTELAFTRTEDVQARRNTEAVKDLESISINKWMKVRRVEAGPAEIDCVERVLLECETEVVMEIERDHD